MDRKPDKVTMEQSKSYNQLRYNSIESRNEEVGTANQRLVQDPSSFINTNMIPPEFTMSGGARPVLNYSIQTGEEFEFMRERVNPRRHLVPNAASDLNSATGYMDLKGILGISHTGSESGSDISMLGTVEKGRVKEFERKDSSLSESKGYYNSMRSVPRTTSGSGIGRGVHGYASSGASDSSSTKLKFLCSFGGKILPRPSDGKLRYVGGDTRIVRISKDISWQELLQKTLSMYNQPHTIKYQLPGEDLDALVSVSCEEDLQNMIEECNVIEDEGSQKLRMFLFSATDVDDPHSNPSSIEGDPEIQYVVAVNGMDVSPKRNSGGDVVPSTSTNNLDELLNLDFKKETSRVAAQSSEASVATLADILAPPVTQLCQPTPSSSSSTFDTHVQSYEGQIMHHREAEQYPFSAAHPPHGFRDVDGRSVPMQYGFYPNPSNHARFVESPVPMPLHGILTPQRGLTGGKPYGGSMGQDPEVSIKDAKMKVDGSVQQKSEDERIQSLENECVVSSQPSDAFVPSFIQAEEPSIATSVPEKVLALSSKNNAKLKDPVQSPVLPDCGNAAQTLKPNEDDHYHSSGGAFTAGYTESEPELGYLEPPLLPERNERIFRSERIPIREQAELLNRLSKSDDSFGSQFLMSHACSDLAQHDSVTEGTDKLHGGGNVASQTEQTMSSAKPPYANPPTIEDGLVQVVKYKELANVTSQMKPNFSEERLDSKLHKSESNHALLRPVDDKDAKNEDAFHHDTDKCRPQKEPSASEIVGSEFPSASQDTSLKHQESLSSHLGEVAPKATYSNYPEGNTHPYPWTGSSARPVSREESSVGVSGPEQGDILIDINDRFPHDFISDVFSRARLSEGSSGINPLPKDGAGLSLNMENHEPQHWSFFQKLAQDEFVKKGVSLIDQDHLGFSFPLTKVDEGSARAYNFLLLKSEGVGSGLTDSQINFDDKLHLESSGLLGADAISSHPDYVHAQDKDSEGVQFDGMSNPKEGENMRTPDSDYEDGKLTMGDIFGPLIDSSFGDFDISTLQIIKNEDLEELRELGSGTFGTVYHGKWRGTDVAIKRIKKSCFTGRSSEQERLTLEFWREAEILSKLHHPNVVAFYGVVQDGPGGTLATVTEYMVNGSLRHVLLRKDRYLDRRKRLIIAMDAAFGMEYLHSKNIVHFDLKCDNLLVNLKDPIRPICKVGDFGLSKIKRNTLVSGGVRGTLPWMAPELLNGSSSKVSEKVDVFSFGIVLWEILTGEEPYANMHYGAIIGGIVNNTLRPHVPSYCDPEWRRLMEQCWAPDPFTRPSFTEIASQLRVMSTASQSKPPGYQAQTQATK
ncbi:uncharacterized protein LOC122076209 [Macadamia integrifolia]|uniref:uncharacterized protein LOC122076209 n=1 Tax=Macadamia integrifolia TaxID=60698 RepID=UPI001C4F29EC|nr:uncharacterized protein LOC122076209 [Macadamia integrifolia]XP_042497466.1 uncharacterized protein LOC122076209 [Macadamia integrifolia]XP_042497467.1 uncharacterized protein LOC122076209 [Macadamia integrifolia]